MKNKCLEQASESELKKLMFRLKKIYALWMVENTVNENHCCIELPQYVNLPVREVRKIHPSMECWALKEPGRRFELTKGDILLKVYSWKSNNKEIRNKELPYYVSGVMTEKNYLVFAMDKNKVITKSFAIDLELMPYTFNDDMMDEVERLKRYIDKHAMDVEELFTFEELFIDEEDTDMNLN